MKYIFLLILSINGSLLFGQAQFTPPPPAERGESSETQDGGSRDLPAQSQFSRLSPTYMGQPLTPVVAPAASGGGSAGPESDPLIERTSFLLDSITRLVLRDSLSLINARIGELHTSAATSRQQSLADYLAEVPSILPVRIRSWAEYRVSSGFGLRWHPIRDMILNHSGIDLPQPMHTPVYATADGIVDRLVYQPGGLGLAVYLRHASGYTSIYGHLADHVLYLGDMVTRGQPIGRVGMSGLTTGPHLHYSILEGKRPVDPLDFCFLLVESLERSNRGGVGPVKLSQRAVKVAARQPAIAAVSMRSVHKVAPSPLKSVTPLPAAVVAGAVLLSIRPLAGNASWSLPSPSRLDSSLFLDRPSSRASRGRKKGI